MKKIYLLFIALIMGAFLLVGCKSDKVEKQGSTTEETNMSISVEHSLGTVEVPINPKKVAIFNNSVLDTIDFLGVSPEIILSKVGLPDYLEKYKGEAYLDAGALHTPDMEKINEFKPDLIIISGRQADLYSEFSSIAPTIYADVKIENFEEDFIKLNSILGKIFNKEDEANKKIKEIKTEIEEIKSLATIKEERALIILTNDGKISAYGSGSRFGLIHDILGIKTVDEGIKVSTHGMGIGFEYIAEKNPDLIFVVDRAVIAGGTNFASKTLENDLIKGTNASKNNKIIYLNPGTWYLSGYGLLSLPMMLEEVKAALK